ncbi:hypothetical protein BDR03DRAFT_963610, partial [Suillus americanus]
MFPAFLTLRHQDPSSALPQCRFLPDMEIFHAMMTFEEFSHEAQERSRSASDALNYACQNWAFHLSRAHSPWDNTLSHLFKSFWSHRLLCWLERQWCLKGLRSCLAILFEAQKFALPEVQNLAKSETSSIRKRSMVSIFLHVAQVPPAHIRSSRFYPSSLLVGKSGTLFRF